MNGIPFSAATIIFGKPAGWKDEDCGGLPVAQSVYPNSDGSHVPCLVSCWQLTPEEALEVAATGRVYLSITGTTMPPVSLMGIDPFPDDYDKEAGLANHKKFCK